MTVRPLRVLHVGNVANNGYNNAKLLNAAGVQSDVLCYGNYHVMASPEWEEAEIAADRVDQDRPDWRVLTDFARPRWFAQGPFVAAANYLEARRRGPTWLAAMRWRILNARRQMIVGRAWAPVRTMRGLARRRPPIATVSPTASPGANPVGYGAARGWSVPRLRSLFALYDIIHAYGEEPIMPWVAGRHPYVAYEHGTLRDLPFQPTLEGQLVAEAYRGADAVVITNADNRVAAERLGIRHYRFIPHAINESVPDAAQAAALRTRLCQELNGSFLVFHPSRQHWSPSRHPHFEKANDLLIEGFATAAAACSRIAGVFVEWGATVSDSRALLERLGVANRVLWIRPQSGPAFARYIMACDVVADQFFLGAFGGITPRSLGLGRPVLLHFDAAAHRWCFGEPPPVINVRTPSEIGAALLRAESNPTWCEELQRAGRSWYDRHHSSTVVRNALLDLYDGLVASSPPHR